MKNIKFNKIFDTLYYSANKFNKNLKDKNIMFVFEDNNGNINKIETIFRDYHFLHLTRLARSPLPL